MVHIKTLCMVCISSYGFCPQSDARCFGSWLHTINCIENGNQKVPEICIVSWYNDRILSCNESFVFANSETETCQESCIIHFPTTPPRSTRVDVLETGDVPILFSLLQMKNLGVTIELDPKGDKISCPAFDLHSSGVEFSTMGHIVLDLTCLAYQPQSRERSARPTNHVPFALMPQKSAYPAHSQECDDDEDDKLVVRSDRTTVSEDEER